MVLIGHDHLDDGGAPNIWRHCKSQSVCSVRISRGHKEKHLVHCLHCEGEQLKLPRAERDTIQPAHAAIQMLPWLTVMIMHKYHVRTHLWVWNAASEVLDKMRQDMLARAFIDCDIRRNSKLDCPGAYRRRIDIDFKKTDGGRDWRKTGVSKRVVASIV